jgi:hypothetical protein
LWTNKREKLRMNDKQKVGEESKEEDKEKNKIKIAVYLMFIKPTSY